MYTKFVYTPTCIIILFYIQQGNALVDWNLCCCLLFTEHYKCPANVEQLARWGFRWCTIAIPTPCTCSVGESTTTCGNTTCLPTNGPYTSTQPTSQTMLHPRLGTMHTSVSRYGGDTDGESLFVISHGTGDVDEYTRIRGCTTSEPEHGQR